jgi:outer membrane protein assembly factor BamB
VVVVLGAFAPAAAQAVRVSAAGAAHAAVSPGTQLWAKLYNENVDSGHANAVAVSPNGNMVFVTGTNGKAGSVASDYATIAYSTATGVQKWIKLYRGPGGGDSCDFDNAVAVSPDGSTVFVTGECETASSRNDYTTVAYSAATGAQKWVKLYNGVGTLNYGNALAVSPDSKTVFVTGESDAKDLEGQYGTVAYSAATGAQLWATRYGGGPRNSNDIAHSVAVSPDGRTVFVTGVSSDGIGATFTDDATVAYNAATGAQLWAARHHGVPIGNVTTYDSLAVSPTGGAVYVTGITGESGAPGAGYDTVAYTAATGAQLWAKHYATNAGAYAVAVSPDGSTVYVTGTAFRAHRGYGYATVAYNAATGAQLWAKIHLGTFGGLPTAQAYAVALSPNGSTVYVTGLSAARTVYDYDTIAYDAATGAQQWGKLYRIPGNTSAYGRGPVAEAVSPTSGTVIVTGADVDGEWATVAYSG